jgi:hypothetical protein
MPTEPVKVYRTPHNVVQLLDQVTGAAAATRFYRRVLEGRPRITSLDDFFALPVTPLTRYRRQPLADVVADPAGVQWIVGPYKGHSGLEVAVAEGVGETGARYELLKDAMREFLGNQRPRTCVIVTAPEKRYYAAEISSILGYLGMPAHLFIHHGNSRTYERLHQIGADVLVILSDDINESDLPPCVELCITFRRSAKLERFSQLDLYVVDEFGFLGHSTDLERWMLYNDQYFFERSEDDRLIVTALHNRVQPLLRLETQDSVATLGEYDLELGHMAPYG